MSTRKRNVHRAGAGLGALALATGSTLVWGSPAHAAAPEGLASFFAASAATPVGVVSRVPAETDGGFVYAKSLVQLGKSQGLAAAFTLGELGDLFVVSSAPPNTITAMPTVVTAQEPPSDTSPRESTMSAGESGAPGFGEVRNADFAARAADSPTGTANAAGYAITTAVLRTGAAVSRSLSAVSPDGTVTTSGTTTVQDIVIGTGPTPLTIAMVQSTATVTIPPGGKPLTDLQIHMSGVKLAGVPVVINAEGIRLADQAPVAPASLEQVNSALAGLTVQGITVTAEPAQSAVDATGVRVSGSALSVRYALPDGPVPKPSNIGSDETFELGSVFARADARARGGLPAASLTPAAQTPAAPAAPGAAVESADTAISALPGTPPAIAVAGAPATAPADVSMPHGLALAARTSSLLPDSARDGYRLVLVAAAVAVAAVIHLIRKSPLA